MTVALRAQLDFDQPRATAASHVEGRAAGETIGMANRGYHGSTRNLWIAIPPAPRAPLSLIVHRTTRGRP